MTDLRYALRQLFKSPSFSGTAIFALALGIGATTAMFAVIYAFLLRPLPFGDAEKLVMLQSRSTRSGSDLGVNYQDFADWKKQSLSFSDMAFFNLRWNGNLESPDGATETLKTTFTTANLFTLLGVEPLVGRNMTQADDEPSASKVVLISERLWRKTFGGNPAIVGREVRLDGSARTVVGVMPAGFRFPSQTDLWVPMTSVFSRNGDRSWRADQAIGRLKPGLTVSQAQAEMTLIAERLARQYPDTNKEIGATVIPLRDHWTGGVRFSLLLLLAGCGGVLLIACANVSQLLLARAATRERELAVRTALGASRWRLARQVLTESALLALIGSLVGALMAFWLVDFVAASIPIELPFWIKIDVSPRVLIFTVIVSCFTALLAGFLPAWQSTRVGISESLKTAGAGNTGSTGIGARSRELLTVAQVAVSDCLARGRQFGFAQHAQVEGGRSRLRCAQRPDDGSESRLTTVTKPAQTRVDRFTRVLQRISEMPGVEAVAANNSPPFVPQRPWNRAEFTAEHQSADEQSRNPRANFQTVSARLFSKRSGFQCCMVEFLTSATNWMRYAFA